MIINGEILKAFSLKFGMRRGCLLLLFNSIFEILGNETRKEKIKSIMFKKEEIKGSLFTDDIIILKIKNNLKINYWH